MPTAIIARRLVAVTFAGLASLLASAQTSTVSINNTDNAASAVWRAASRLGYAPTPDHAAASAPRTWALNQIDVAYLASQQPAAIPPELARINAPLDEIALTEAEESMQRAIKRQSELKALHANRSPS